MKNKSSCRGHARLGISLFFMFLLLIIVYTPSARSPLALAAESEPMVSLPGGVPPQAPQLLAAAVPAPADMLLRLRIILELRSIDGPDSRHSRRSRRLVKLLVV